MSNNIAPGQTVAVRVVTPELSLPSDTTGRTDTAANVRTVRRYYETVDADAVEELVALFAVDGVYRRPGYQPLEGRKAIERFYRDQRVIESGRHTLTHVTAEAAAVAVHGEFDGVLKDGTRVALRFADFFEFDAQGLFARRDTFFFAPAV
ncbi:nuclear transport factor 2 family protein [Actinokineospora terrae]|uniref:Ketosteroid isomerase-related protein n=1 Tax=Actinokineospora terrae TaxID=155974 RepID=A0A1H9XAJ0_9PSEU|nr:nuclear transport factor 2 family protein [Actinokineospora terrae]SES42653.1 Ketosteroid isomerase-related protein [Actinokineospora terrae]